MPKPARLWQTHKVVQLLAPATDAAGRTSAYYSMKDVHKAWIIFEVTQGNAATIALSPLQASAVAGTGSKALTAAVPIVSNLDTAAGETDTERTAATSYTTDAGVKNKQVMFEIDPAACMDINNGFDCIGFSTGASNAANITSAVLVMAMRYQQTTPPAVATD